MEREERLQREWMRLHSVRQESNYTQPVDLPPRPSITQPLPTTSTSPIPTNFGSFSTPPPPPPPPPTLSFSPTPSPHHHQPFTPQNISTFPRKMTPDFGISNFSLQNFTKIPSM